MEWLIVIALSAYAGYKYRQREEGKVDVKEYRKVDERDLV